MFIRLAQYALALLAFVPVAQAATEFAAVPLEELMETSIASISKMEIPLNKSPVTAFIVTQDEITHKGYRYLTDILKNTPGIHLANLAYTEKAITEIYVRGVFANNKITVLVDGIKVKSPTGEPVTFLQSIPLIGVKQVEISLGSASAIYGADAMLATINLVTQGGAAIDGIRVKATVGNFDTGEVQVAAGSKLTEDLTVALTGSFHRSDTEDFSDNYPAEYAGTGPVDLKEQNHNVHFKLNYKDLTLSYYRLFNKNNSSLGFTPLPPAAYIYSGAAFLANLNQTVNATYAWDITPFWQAKSSLSYESNELLPESSYQNYGGVEHKAWHGEAMRFTQNVVYQRDKINWLSGTELSFMKSTPKYTVEDPGFNKVDVSYQNYAVFSQLDYAWTDALTVSGSVRMDSDSRYTPQFNPRVGFSWQALKPLRFFGAWGTSFLAPAPLLIYEKWGEPTWASYHRPNPQLQPEKISTYELGIDMAPSKNSLLKLLGFYTEGTDLMRVVDNTGTGLANYNGNVASLSSYGMQAVAGQRFDNGLDFNLDYTLTLGRQDAEKKDNGTVGLTNAPAHMIKGNAAYTLGQFSLRFTGRWFDKVGTHESNALYAGETVNGTLLFDSNLHYGGQLNQAKWSVDFGVDNLFDRKYYTIPQVDNFFDSLPRQPQETRKLYLTLGLSY
ncbi:MAG: TonB-dependent receptor [Methylobacter sp.]|nr:TonB-dependent receptor [Methylobacter sp.]MDP2429525.1 TonB-dependent receptor [Methylobacter sp.]MDP3056043.1 TonB-dependent receptor [Methylobacter sp.]MDP3361887.1 TonB-dependent receptor [Methylobacter sp.]MDZ4220854.1 TonB-dependent receptor [Methylobacter sp.]